MFTKHVNGISMKFLKAVCIAVLTIQVTTLYAAASQISDHGVTQTILPNGLTILTKEVHASPVVCTYVWYRVGSRNEVTGVTGVSHQLEHMMFKGTRKLLKPGDIDILIGRHGGVNNAETGSDTTSYYFLLPADQVDVALQIEADRMTQALIDPQQLKAEKTVVLSELEGGENDNSSFLYDQTRAQSYLYHPYHFPVIGTKWDVNHYTRQQVYDYYRDYYAPNNATLVVVGDFDTTALLAKIKKLWKDVKPSPTKHAPLDPEPLQRGERRITVRRAGPTSYVQIMAHIPRAASPDLAPLTVLATALASGKSSILYKALVETQLATSVAASANQGIDPETFEIAISARAGVDPGQVEKALKAELDSVEETPLDEHTVSKAKNQTRASFIFAQDSVLSQASRLGFYQTVTGNWKNEYAFLDQIAAVKPSDVLRVAHKYLDADNRTIGTFIPTIEGAAGSGAELHPHRSGYPAIGSNPRHASYRSSNHLASYAPESQIKSANTGSTTSLSEFILPNKMHVLIKENHANPTVTISGFIRAGSVDDPSDKDGLASFVADMLTRGTDRLSSQQIAEETEFVGASFSFDADRERTGISGSMLKENFQSILKLIAESLQHPSFPTDEIEKERGERLTILRETQNNTGSVAVDRLFRLLYPKSSFAHRPLGTLEGLNSITQSDLISFFHSAYRPENTTLVIVGDIATSSAKELIESLFADWNPDGPALPKVIPSSLTPNTTTNRPIVITIPDKSQCDIAMGSVAFSRNDPDYVPAMIMNLILGEDEFVGRVGKRVRDTEGLAYYAFTRFQPGLQRGPWLFRAGVNPKNVVRVLASARDEIRKMAAAGVTAKELSWAKDHAIGALKLSYASSGGIAAHIAEEAFYGLGWDYQQKYASAVRALSLSGVNTTARKYLQPEFMPVVIAGPVVPGLKDAIVETGAPGKP